MPKGVVNSGNETAPWLQRLGRDTTPYTEVLVRLPKPHPLQAQFVEQKVARKVVRAGRRGGKTFGVAILACMAFLQGRRVLYATPTSDQFNRFWDLVKQFLGPAVTAGLYLKNENQHTIVMPGTNARIKCKTAWNADSLRGDFADLLILDEYQLMSEDAWSVVGAPMLLDSGGDAVFVYTPPSAGNLVRSKAIDKRHATKLFRRAAADTTGRWRTYTFTSHDNPHLDTVALSEITQDMTKLAYRQEILAEELDEVPGALWTRSILDETRVQVWPEDMVRIVIGVDPKVTEYKGESETGIIAAGLDSKGHFYVMDDNSTNEGPDGWAKASLRTYDKMRADRIVAEINQGGALVKSVIRQYNKRVPIHTVRATRGKAIRAEPVSALWEQGKAHVVGELAILEEQLVTFVPGDRHSPDRLDAMVWAITALMQSKSNIRNATQKYAWRDADPREMYERLMYGS